MTGLWGRGDVSCRPRYPGITFQDFDAAMASLAGFPELTIRRRANTYLGVCGAVRAFDLHREFDIQRKPSALAADLKDIRLSVGRIARLVGPGEADAFMQSRARFALIRAAEKWKADHPDEARNSVSNLGAGRRDGTVDLGPATFVNDFFQSARILRDVIRTAIKDLEAAEQWKPERTAIQSLVGKRLPAIFERSFGRRFTMTVSAHGTNSDGVEFIRAVLSCFHIVKADGDPIDPHTIKRHYEEAKRKDHAAPEKSAG